MLRSENMSSPGIQNTADWWVTMGDPVPLGPMSTEQLIGLIRSGEIPGDALVCEVGGSAWRALGDVPELATAPGTFDPDTARTNIEPERFSHQVVFDDPHEHTIVERPVFASSDDLEDAAEEDEDLPTIRPVAPLDDPD
jgi:hypothetical protein